MELSTPFSMLEPGELPPMMAPAIAETLVRTDEQGEIEPWLAASWQREAGGKRWRFSLRPNVTFHDGEPMSASSVGPMLQAALKKIHSDVSVLAGGQTMVVQADRAMPDLLEELASPGLAIVRRTETGGMIGTGPFRVTAWEPGRRLVLAAFNDYWGGRPFLDSVTINFGASRATGDLFDIPFASPRRIAPEATRLWSSLPRDLLALTANDVHPQVWQALALAIDRAPIVDVLTQGRGQAAFGLLPQWLSGYAFLFETAPDVARARQLVAQLRLTPLTLAYAASDSFARAVAERIALNAREAGIAIRTSAGSNGNLRLVRAEIESKDAAAELARVASSLGMTANPLDSTKPEALYQAERDLLAANRAMPLVYLPAVFGMAPRVHNAGRGDAVRLRLEDLWVDP
jgi:peptide/nickel transport system substrate-binding protein